MQLSKSSMAIYYSLPRSLSTTSLHFLPNQYSYSPGKPSLLSRRNIHQWRRLQIIASKRRHFRIRNSAFCAPKHEKNEEPTHGSLSHVVGKSTGFFRSVLPGGGWWSLPEHDEAQFASTKPVTVWFAVRRMWELVGDERWIAFVAFGALIFAAVSSIPKHCLIFLKKFLREFHFLLLRYVICSFVADF